MTLYEFFDVLGSLPDRWRFVGNTIRTFDGGRPSEAYSPLEVVCFYKGGTVSWQGGRTYRPSLLDFHFQHGRVLGLSDADTHAIFRASDNDIVPEPGRHLRDYLIRKCLIETCKPFREKDATKKESKRCHSAPTEQP